MTGRHRKPATVKDRVGDLIEAVAAPFVLIADVITGHPEPPTVDATTQIPGPADDQPSGPEA